MEAGTPPGPCNAAQAASVTDRQHAPEIDEEEEDDDEEESDEVEDEDADEDEEDAALFSVNGSGEEVHTTSETDRGGSKESEQVHPEICNNCR